MRAYDLCVCGGMREVECGVGCGMECGGDEGFQEGLGRW